MLKDMLKEWLLTFLTIKYIAPIKSAIEEVSPIVPAVFPINILIKSKLSPFFKIASGVDEVIPSNTKFVILPVKEINKKHLAANAGFIKFCPSPPNSCFTIKIAKILPRIGSHHGTEAGRFKASSNPVTAALQSEIVTFL